MKKRISILLCMVIICSVVAIVSIINNKLDRIELENKTIEFSNKEEIIRNENINPEEILFSEMNIVELIYNASDVEDLAKESDVIAIVKFLSKEGTNVYIGNGERVSTVFTNGNIEVEKLYLNKTNLKEGDIIKYQRPNGIIKFSEYVKGQQQSHVDKLIYNIERKRGLSQEEMMNMYVNSYSYNNAMIEYNKEYLAFLKYYPDADAYMIEGYEYGLREIQDGFVLNNETKEYESLEDIVNKIK